MSNNKSVSLTQSYLTKLFMTPSSELPSSELHKRINEDCGTDFSANDVKKIYNIKLNLFFRNRPRATESDVDVDIVFDLNESNENSVNADNNDSLNENEFSFEEQTNNTF
jgi:hypothetical protein